MSFDIVIWLYVWTYRLLIFWIHFFSLEWSHNLCYCPVWLSTAIPKTNGQRISKIFRQCANSRIWWFFIWRCLLSEKAALSNFRFQNLILQRNQPSLIDFWIHQFRFDQENHISGIITGSKRNWWIQKVYETELVSLKYEGFEILKFERAAFSERRHRQIKNHQILLFAHWRKIWKCVDRSSFGIAVDNQTGQ